MNCRTFHRNLEDYLEDGLDFSGRFGMERHAQQCIRCGKEMAGALRLRQMASELVRVKAPLNFESSVLHEIGMRKAHGRFSGIRSFWIYGLEWASWRKLALASCSLIFLGFGMFYLSHRTAPDSVPTPPMAVSKPSAAVMETKNNPGAIAAIPARPKPVAIKTPKPAIKANPPESLAQERFAVEDELDAEYIDYMGEGPDNRPMPIRLPKRIRMQHGPASEEYFIRNISH